MGFTSEHQLAIFSEGSRLLSGIRYLAIITVA
jgi:hypothetical protein